MSASKKQYEEERQREISDEEYKIRANIAKLWAEYHFRKTKKK